MGNFLFNPGTNPVTNNDGVVVTFIRPWLASQTYSLTAGSRVRLTSVALAASTAGCEWLTG